MTLVDDAKSRTKGTGKWCEPGVPHRGWYCTGVEDVCDGAEFCSPDIFETCEMCEVAQIRYVHFMEHDDYPDTLAVGCICAENMANDYVSPKLREAKLRRLAARRISWAQRQWKVSAKGNSYLRTDGYNITVFQSASGGYKSCITNKTTEKKYFSSRTYDSPQAAKTRTLDGLLWVKDKEKDQIRDRPRCKVCGYELEDRYINRGVCFECYNDY